jgi:hypothetical protein
MPRELAVFDSFPLIFTAFHSHAIWNRLGLCWRLGESVAERFAAAYRWQALAVPWI